MRGRVGALIEIAAGFHGDLTGRENVFMQGAILGMRRAEIQRKFDEIVDFSGIGEFIDTPVKRYSSGMNARLGFAVAAHLDPEVLLDRRSARGRRPGVSGEVLRAHAELRAVGHRDRVRLAQSLGRLDALQPCACPEAGLHGGIGPTHEAITVYANLTQAARVTELGPDAVTAHLFDARGKAVSDIPAGDALVVRVTAGLPPRGERFHAELQIRHLESGTLIYRAQSLAFGAKPIAVEQGQAMEFVWSLQANLARGHYGIACVILSEKHTWVASSPTRC